MLNCEKAPGQAFRDADAARRLPDGVSAICLRQAVVWRKSERAKNTPSGPVAQPSVDVGASQGQRLIARTHGKVQNQRQTEPPWLRSFDSRSSLNPILRATARDVSVLPNVNAFNAKALAYFSDRAPSQALTASLPP